MKKTKNIWLIILSIALLVSSSTINVFAQPDLSGRDPNVPVTLTIHHRTLPDGTITPGNPSSPGLPEPLGVPIVGAQWQIQRVDLPSGFDWNDNEAVAAIPTEWLLGAPLTQTTNASGQAIFLGLEQGIFLVTELQSSVTSADEVHRPFLVDLPMFFNNAWVYDVHVYPKQEAEEPFFEKVVRNLDGHIITWAFHVDIMPGLGTLLPIEGSVPASFIRIVDELDPRLNFIPDSINVSFETSPTNFQDIPIGVPYWTLSWDEPNNTFVVDILEGGRNFIAENGYTNSGYGGIRIEFDTSVEGIAFSSLGEIENTGTLYYGPRPAHEYGSAPGEVPPTATAFGLEINKINTRNLPLEGAVFHLYRQSDVEEYDGNVVVRYDATPLAILTSGVDGFAYLYGLTMGRYLLVEQQAPEGYNPFTEPIVLWVESNTASSDYIVEATITNSSGFELPLTGGSGTLLFTIIGLTLIGGAALFLIIYMKRRNEEEEKYK